MQCDGNSADHCCYLGTVCRYLEQDTVPGRRWACGLYRQLGSWGAVYTSAEYLRDVRNRVKSAVGMDCGDWPPPGEMCQACGKTNNG